MQQGDAFVRQLRAILIIPEVHVRQAQHGFVRTRVDGLQVVLCHHRQVVFLGRAFLQAAGAHQIDVREHQVRQDVAGARGGREPVDGFLKAILRREVHPHRRLRRRIVLARQMADQGAGQQFLVRRPPRRRPIGRLHVEVDGLHGGVRGRRRDHQREPPLFRGAVDRPHGLALRCPQIGQRLGGREHRERRLRAPVMAVLKGLREPPDPSVMRLRRVFALHVFVELGQSVVAHDAGAMLVEYRRPHRAGAQRLLVDEAHRLTLQRCQALGTFGELRRGEKRLAQRGHIHRFAGLHGRDERFVGGRGLADAPCASKRCDGERHQTHRRSVAHFQRVRP